MKYFVLVASMVLGSFTETKAGQPVTYDPSTGEIVITFGTAKSWEIQSLSSGLTGDSPNHIFSSLLHAFDTDDHIGEVHPFFNSSAIGSLGFVAAINLPLGDLSWTRGIEVLDNVTYTSGPVDYLSQPIPEPSSCVMVLLALILLNTVRNPLYRARLIS